MALTPPARQRHEQNPCGVTAVPEDLEIVLTSMKARIPRRRTVSEGLFFCLSVISVLTATPYAPALQQGSASTPVRYTRSVWRVSDGLPEDTVQALAESPEGALWIGTTGGLAKFAGVRMQTSNIGLPQSVGVNSIFCLTVAHDGSLWAGTEGGGLLHLQGTTISVLTGQEGLSDGFVRTVFEDEAHRLWVGTDNGLFLMQGKRMARVDGEGSIPSLAVHSIMEDRDHRIWAGGSALVAIEPDGKARAFTLPGAYSENRVKKILQTADGTVWVGTVGGLSRLHGGVFESVHGIHATVRSLLQTSDGTLWIGTIGDGLWTLQNEVLSKIKNAGLLPSETVLSLLQDDEDQVWIGTQAGLVRLNRTPVRLLPLPNPGDPDFETISGDDRGDIWVAAQELYTVHGGVAQKANYGLPGVSVRNVYRARDRAIWIGTDGSGVYRISGGKTTHYSAPEQLTNNFIRAFMESRENEMWIATDEGVSALNESGARKYTEASGLAYFSTRCLLQDRKGAIWIGTDRGLSELVDGEFQQNEATRALAHEKVWSILEDRQGSLWFGTRDHGIFRYQNGVLQQLTMEQGLPSNSIYQLLQDRRGTFWITGPNTIASVREADMDDGTKSSEHPLNVTVYRMPFGADDAQMYGGREPAGYLAADDSVWFPTNRGVAHVSQSGQPTGGPPPRAALDEVVENGRAIALGDVLEVPAAVTRISFRFSAVYLRPQDQVRFRYRLENFDNTWLAAGPDNVATYTNLKAGRYIFRVQTYDSSRPAAMTETSVELKKVPVFYERAWFYVLCCAVLAGMTWAIYYLRLRQLRIRFEAVLEERNRLAREMHDTVIQGCTGVSALLEAIASRSDRTENTSRELLDYAREQTRTTIDEARQVVWDMRHERESGIEITEAMRTYAAQIMREYKGIGIEMHAREPIWLRASVAHEILMIVREAVYNAVQHSGTDRLELAAEVRKDEVVLSIADYGSGIAKDVLHGSRDGHYGIVGMQERVKRLGGKLDLITSRGTGTTFQLVVAHASKLKHGEHT
jgi:ligand-binding sensor domain-containing protein/signal transduction histidine kinase